MCTFVTFFIYLLVMTVDISKSKIVFALNSLTQMNYTGFSRKTSFVDQFSVLWLRIGKHSKHLNTK